MHDLLCKYVRWKQTVLKKTPEWVKGFSSESIAFSAVTNRSDKSRWKWEKDTSKMFFLRRFFLCVYDGSGIIKKKIVRPQRKKSHNEQWDPLILKGLTKASNGPWRDALIWFFWRKKITLEVPKAHKSSCHNRDRLRRITDEFNQ